jgi:hypothetical protein
MQLDLRDMILSPEWIFSTLLRISKANCKSWLALKSHPMTSIIPMNDHMVATRKDPMGLLTDAPQNVLLIRQTIDPASPPARRSDKLVRKRHVSIKILAHSRINICPVWRELRSRYLA